MTKGSNGGVGRGATKDNSLYNISPALKERIDKAQSLLDAGNWSGASSAFASIAEDNPDIPHGFIGCLLAACKLKDESELATAEVEFDRLDEYSRLMLAADVDTYNRFVDYAEAARNFKKEKQRRAKEEERRKQEAERLAREAKIKQRNDAKARRRKRINAVTSTVKNKKVWIPTVAVACLVLTVVLLRIPSLEYERNGDGYTLTDMKGGFFGGLKIPSEHEGLPVTEIGDRAFENRAWLTSVHLPKTVEEIGESAFAGCSRLSRITVDEDSEYYISKNKSLYCVDGTIVRCGINRDNRKFEIPEGTEEIGSDAFSGFKKLSSVSIPDSVQRIGENAFLGCESLESVTIPQSVTAMGEYCFDECPDLTLYYEADKVPTNGDWYSYVTGYRVSEGLRYTLSDNEKYYSVSRGSCSDSEIVIAHTYRGLPVKEIEESAFAGHKSLLSVIVPKTVNTIGAYAFANCSLLYKIDLPDRMESVGDYAFNYCESLGDITVWAKKIGSYAFAYCSSLTRANIYGGVKKMGSYVFSFSNENLVIYCGDDHSSLGWDSNWNTEPPSDGGFYIALFNKHTVKWGISSLSD